MSYANYVVCMYVPPNQLFAVRSRAVGRFENLWGQRIMQCCQIELRWRFRDLFKCFKNEKKKNMQFAFILNGLGQKINKLFHRFLKFGLNTWLYCLKFCRKCLISPRHSCYELYALVLVENPFPRLSPWQNCILY